MSKQHNKLHKRTRRKRYVKRVRVAAKSKQTAPPPAPNHAPDGPEAAQTAPPEPAAAVATDPVVQS